MSKIITTEVSKKLFNYADAIDFYEKKKTIYIQVLLAVAILSLSSFLLCNEKYVFGFLYGSIGIMWLMIVIKGGLFKKSVSKNKIVEMKDFIYNIYDKVMDKKENDGNILGLIELTTSISAKARILALSKM